MAAATSALAERLAVVDVSRPWWTPHRGAGPAGLVATAKVHGVQAQRLRATLWQVETLLQPDAQLEVLAGFQRGRLRWAVDPEDEPAWVGPLCDIAPALPLRNGLTVREQALVRPHRGSYPATQVPTPAWSAAPPALATRPMGWIGSRPIAYNSAMHWALQPTQPLP